MSAQRMRIEMIDTFRGANIIGTPAFPLVALMAASQRNLEERGMARSEEKYESDVRETGVETSDYDYRSGEESAFDTEMAALLAMIEAGDWLQETADDLVGQYENGMSCVSPAGIADRGRRLAAMVVRAEQGEPGQADVARWKDLGAQLKRMREGCGLSRQLLANLSGVPRDDIFCLEHGILESNVAKDIVPRLAKFLNSENRPLKQTTTHSSHR